MSNHRFRNLLETLPFPSRLSSVLPESPFVPCPVVSLMTISQQAQVLEIYRIAAERTQAQLRTARRALPEFSLN